jgi:addiction module antidote protein, HigA family
MGSEKRIGGHVEDKGAIGNIHPGEILDEEFMTPLGITAYRLAKETGLSQTQIGEVVRGERAITPATALRLAAFFGTSAQFWLNLQTSYDLEEETKRLGDALKEIRPLVPA